MTHETLFATLFVIFTGALGWELGYRAGWHDARRKEEPDND